MIREKDVEQALIRAVRKSGGVCWKLVCPGVDGVPDRLCLWPHGEVAFAEVKKPGGKPRPLQVRRIAQLRSMGFRVVVIDSPESAAAFIPATTESRKTKPGGGGDA